MTSSNFHDNRLIEVHSDADFKYVPVLYWASDMPSAMEDISMATFKNAEPTIFAISGF